MSAVEIDGDLDPIYSSGSRNFLVLDPTGTVPRVYMFRCDGPGLPEQVHMLLATTQWLPELVHKQVHMLLATIPYDVVGDSLAERVEAHADEISKIAERYDGARLVLHTWRDVGRWLPMTGIDMMDPIGVEAEIDDLIVARYVDADDWINDQFVRDELVARKPVEDIVRDQIEQAAELRVHLHVDGVTRFVEEVDALL